MADIFVNEKAQEIYPHGHYYDVDLCWIVNEIHHLQAQIDAINLDLDNLATKAELAAAVANLQQQINAFERRVTWLKDYVDHSLQTQNETIQRWIMGELSRFQQMINDSVNAIYDVIRNTDAQTRIWVTAQWEKFLRELPDYTTILVYSPVSGKLVTIQVALDELYKEMRYDSLTAAEYDALQLTVAEYDAKQLTAYQYDFHARYYLLSRWIPKMISPFSGELVPIPEVIYELADLHKEEHALTAAMYDNKGLTAEEYDNLQVTAYHYDWEGNLYVN